VLYIGKYAFSDSRFQIEHTHLVEAAKALGIGVDQTKVPSDGAQKLSIVAEVYVQPSIILGAPPPFAGMSDDIVFGYGCRTT
jgi:hypothetical protein